MPFGDKFKVNVALVKKVQRLQKEIKYQKRVNLLLLTKGNENAKPK